MEKHLLDYLGHPELINFAPATMIQRMIKSSEEIALIREGARIADVGGEAIRTEIQNLGIHGYGSSQVLILTGLIIRLPRAS